jgi:adenylyltransferase/sulfurtransferase
MGPSDVFADDVRDRGASTPACAGVGRLTIADRDYVEPSNLPRQWLFEEAEALPKAVAAARSLYARYVGS